jgi:hypothetical protein
MPGLRPFGGVWRDLVLQKPADGLAEGFVILVVRGA